MTSIFKNEKLLKLNNNWKFENIIVLIFMIFGILGWQFNYAIGAIPTIILSLVLMLFYDDFKYGIPAILVLLFSYGVGFDSQKFPFDIVIPVAIFVIFVVIFTIRKFNIEKLKKIKSLIGMSILAISFILPIFWANFSSEFSVFYVMYFSWLMYTLLYLLLYMNISKNAFRILVFSLSWLACLLGYELVIELMRLTKAEPNRSFMSFTYYIGWGLCNEAGIILCFIMPFIFYELISSKSLAVTLISIFKIFLSLFFIFITNSRGSLLFGIIEFIVLFIIMFFKSFDLKRQKLQLFSFSIIVVITVVGYIMIKYEALTDISNTIFKEGFDSNGRSEMWSDAIKIWTSSFRNVVFGSGIISEIKEKSLYHEVMPTFVVYHSTVLEVLVSAGLIGFIGLVIHMFEKFKMLFRVEKTLAIFMLVGYIVVDIYGMIDNTYGMYYYMVPLMIVFAVINNSKNYKLYNRRDYSLLF